MPRSQRPNRDPVSCSLPPEKAARLRAEADARLVSPSLLLEKGFDLLVASFDHPLPEDAPKGGHVADPKPEIQG